MFAQQLERFIEIVKENEKDNLKAVILIGSGANDSFVKGASDFDFIFIFEKIDFRTLEFLNRLKYVGQSTDMLGTSIDIQLLTQAEIRIARERNATIRFFHNLTIKYIAEGKYKILYEANDAQIDYHYTIEGIKKDALYSASYCIFGLRRILVDGTSKFPPLRSTPDKDFVKLCAGLCKHVVEFCLAYKEVYCLDINMTLQEAQRLFGYDMTPLQQACELRGKEDVDLQILREAYELAEKIHMQTITPGC